MSNTTTTAQASRMAITAIANGNGLNPQEERILADYILRAMVNNDNGCSLDVIGRIPEWIMDNQEKVDECVLLSKTHMQRTTHAMSLII